MSRDYINLRMLVPRLQGMRVFLEAAPGRVVTEVNRKIVSDVATKGVGIMRREVRREFALYSAGATRANGEPYRWQTPTGALANSIGKNVLKARKTRNKNVAMAWVGPRTSFKVTKAVQRRIDRFTTLGINTEPGTPFDAKPAPPKVFAPNGPSGQTVAPARYAHLAAFGHRRGRGILAAKPHDFMTPTLQKIDRLLSSVVRSSFPRRFQQTVGADSRRILRRLQKVRITV